MRRNQNIRNADDRSRLLSKGRVWATILSRGEHKGLIMSVHNTYEAANAMARGTDRTIVEISAGDSV